MIYQFSSGSLQTTCNTGTAYLITLTGTLGNDFTIKQHIRTALSTDLAARGQACLPLHFENLSGPQGGGGATGAVCGEKFFYGHAFCS